MFYFLKAHITRIRLVITLLEESDFIVLRLGFGLGISTLIHISVRLFVLLTSKKVFFKKIKKVLIKFLALFVYAFQKK